ncbi:MAG: Uma2 family endonuclease [Cyanobacteria bacterium P01_F01_bin.86]
MTQASFKSLTKPLNFVEFLAWEADGAQYDLLADGSLIEVPEEAEINSAIALELAFWLAEFVRRRLIKINCLTLEVEPVGDNRVNRRPDLAVIKPEHLEIGTFAKRTALQRGELPPRFVAEVVSPGEAGYQRDYVWKRQQYQDWQIPEYWIIDPHQEQLTVLLLKNGIYQESIYQGAQPVKSREFPDLKVNLENILGRA